MQSVRVLTTVSLPSAEINITSDNTVRLEGKSIIQNGSQNVQIKGNKPGECAVNGKELMKLLMNLGRMIDQKVPATAGVASSLVAASRSSILNENIQYI